MTLNEIQVGMVFKDCGTALRHVRVHEVGENFFRFHECRTGANGPFDIRKSFRSSTPQRFVRKTRTNGYRLVWTPEGGHLGEPYGV